MSCLSRSLTPKDEPLSHMLVAAKTQGSQTSNSGPSKAANAMATHKPLRVKWSIPEIFTAANSKEQPRIHHIDLRRSVESRGEKASCILESRSYDNLRPIQKQTVQFSSKELWSTVLQPLNQSGSITCTNPMLGRYELHKERKP